MVNPNHYLFVINIVPMQENEINKDIAGAKAHICVISSVRERAKLRAIDYIKKHLWNIVNVEYELLIHEEQIPNLHEDEFALYKSALHSGIAAHFLAYPKES